MNSDYQKEVKLAPDLYLGANFGRNCKLRIEFDGVYISNCGEIHTICSVSPRSHTLRVVSTDEIIIGTILILIIILLWVTAIYVLSYPNPATIPPHITLNHITNQTVFP